MDTYGLGVSAECMRYSIWPGSGMAFSCLSVLSVGREVPSCGCVGGKPPFRKDP